MREHVWSKKAGNKLGYWLFFFLSFHWTNYRVLKTAEFPSSINLSLDYFTAAAYLPVALLLCGSNCCLALRWNASENRFFPLNCLPQNCLYKNPLQLSLVHQLQWFATPTILSCLYHRGEKIAGTKVHELNFTGSTTHHRQGKQITKDDSWIFFPVWQSAGKFAVTFSKHEIFNVIIESNVTHCLGKEKHLIWKLLLSYFFWLAR